MSGAIRGEKWVDLKGKIIARYIHGNKRFEVIMDPDLAWRYRKDPNSVDIRDILEGFYIFEDARKGKKASEEDLKNVFGTDDVFEIASKIVLEGELQLTSEQRRKLIEEKLDRVIKIISRNGINPKTNLPHPPERIRKAIEQAKVSIDPFKPDDEVVKEVVEAIRPIIPIRLETLVVEVLIPPQFTGKAYGVVKQFGNVLEEEWLSNGAWKAKAELPAGLHATFLDKINKITSGKASVKVIERK